MEEKLAISLNKLELQEVNKSNVQKKKKMTELTSGKLAENPVVKLVTRSDLEPKDLPLYSMAEVSNHCDFNDCWIVLWDKVYDVTEFIKEHPGGEDIILENAGRDATVSFMEVGHSKDALLILRKYQVGLLIESQRIFKRTRFETY